MKEEDFWLRHVKEGASLSRVDRISEVLFGLIMVLSFTGAINVLTEGREEVSDLLWAALGCNAAWGIIDAIMYWMNIVIERARASHVLQKLHATEDLSLSREITKGELPSYLGELLTDLEIDQLNDRLRKVSEPPGRIFFTFKDLRAGIEIFLLVFLCTLPVALPFGILQEVNVALRVSNVVAIILLFIGGYRLARYSGLRPGVTAIIYTLIGVALVSLTMALGG